MDILLKIELDLAETRREEPFPIQEQEFGPVTCRTERLAAVVLAERLAEADSGFAASLFIP